MGLARLLAIALMAVVAAPVAAQDTSSAPPRTAVAAPSPWSDLPRVLTSERAVATCTFGAILGMGAALLTSFIDVGVTFGAGLLFGGAVFGCGAWLGEIAAEQFQWRWMQERGLLESGPAAAPPAGP